MKAAKKKNAREDPSYNGIGMTQWFWRVLYKKNFKLGKNTQIGSFTVIDAYRGVEIQDNVKVGFGCAILSYSSIDGKGGKVTLKRNSSVGANSVIMPGVSIGRDSVVGALSFVNKSIPDGQLWVGVPARCIKMSHARNRRKR